MGRSNQLKIHHGGLCLISVASRIEEVFAFDLCSSLCFCIMTVVMHGET